MQPESPDVADDPDMACYARSRGEKPQGKEQEPLKRSADSRVCPWTSANHATQVSNVESRPRSDSMPKTLPLE